MLAADFVLRSQFYISEHHFLVDFTVVCLAA